MEDTAYQKKILTIPNILSLVRLCLIPVFVVLYCGEWDLWAALVLALSAVTDIVDGLIARKFHMISDLGKILDPVADKLTQISVLACMLTRFHYLWVLLILLVCKEVFAAVTGLLAIRNTGKVRGSVWHGKAATVMLYAMMLLHLVWPGIPDIVSFVLVAACTAIVLLSCVLYGIRNIRAIRSDW